MPIACGSFVEYCKDTVEIKNLFVKEGYRNQGLGNTIVKKLEEESKNRGYDFIILETNIHMPIAISFYSKLNYNLIENYPPFVGNELYVCMKKKNCDILHYYCNLIHFIYSLIFNLINLVKLIINLFSLIISLLNLILF